MDVASLSLKVTTDGVESGQAKLDALTQSGARAQLQIDKMRIAGDEMGEGTERLVAKQDAFLQQLDRQAATMGKSAAAMRAYKAEQLGLADDTVFQKLNAQIGEMEEGGDRMGRMLEGMVLRMGVHMAAFALVMKGLSWVFDEIAHGAQKWLDLENKIAGESARDALGISNLAQALKSNADAYANGTNTVNGYTGMLEREEVLRAEMMAMGPEFRDAIYQENGHYKDQLTLLKQITDEKLKQNNAQITVMQQKRPTAGVTSFLGQMPGLGDLFQSAGWRDDLEKLNKYDEDLNKLYKARADLMKSMATLGGDYQKGADAMESIYEVNHRIYELEKITPLGAAKSVPENLIKPLEEKEPTFHFEKLVDGTTLLERKMRDAAKSGDAFATMGLEVMQSSGYAADAITRWANNLDGLGVSWTTLGTTVRNVIADMIRQMERAIVQQQLMDPLLQWAGGWIYNLGQPTPAGSGVGSGIGGAMSGLGSVAKSPQASPTVVNQISVTVNDGKASVSADAGKGGEDIAKNLRGLMNTWAIEQSRSGGLLAAR